MDEMMQRRDIKTKGILINSLYAKEYEDPRDAACLNALKLNKGFDKLVKVFMDYSYERAVVINCKGSNVQVTKESMPYLYGCVEEACSILNVEKIPTIYVEQNPYLNACTIGSRNPILILNSSCLHHFSHEELMFIIGHEIGHIKSEHVQYHMIARFLMNQMSRSTFSLEIPIISDAISTGMYAAFMAWSRYSEITADRAGLLACQSMEAAISAMAKLAGYPEEYYNMLDPKAFLRQAQEFEDLDESIFNRLLRMEQSVFQSHPWSVMRTKEMFKWVQTGEYSRILMRSSTWMKDEIGRLSQISDKAYEKAAKKQNEVFHLKAQDKVKDAVTKKKQNTADAAKVKYQEISAEEKKLRGIYKEADEKEILWHTREMIGKLAEEEIIMLQGKNDDK